MTRKKLAVWKFASCDGCQLSILDLEDELILMSQALKIAFFPEASSHCEPGPYDLSLVEGSITTSHDAERIKEIREQSTTLITIGACATSGGIQALRNIQDVQSMQKLVYPHPEYISTLATSTPIADHVRVDAELRGCPVSKKQLLDLLACYLSGKKPNISAASVCTECKRHQVSCLMVSRGVACLGPVTHAGCDALCPKYDRGCFGCFGSKEQANTKSLASQFADRGMPTVERQRLFGGINNNDPLFKKEGPHG